MRVLIETSPLAILTLDPSGRVQLANESARGLLGFDDAPLQGQQIEPYLPILARLLHSHHSGNNIRTSVECKGQRQNGRCSWRTSGCPRIAVGGPGLAAVVWDASENLRDREGAGLDSMMATSRVLIGAMSHEIRNLASAAASAHIALGADDHFAATITTRRSDLSSAGWKRSPPRACVWRPTARPWSPTSTRFSMRPAS